MHQTDLNAENIFKFRLIREIKRNITGYIRWF